MTQVPHREGTDAALRSVVVITASASIIAIITIVISILLHAFLVVLLPQHPRLPSPAVLTVIPRHCSRVPVATVTPNN